LASTEIRIKQRGVTTFLHAGGQEIAASASSYFCPKNEAGDCGQSRVVAKLRTEGGRRWFEKED